MRRNKILIGLASVALFALTGCNDEFNYVEGYTFDEEYMQNHWSRVGGFVAKIYDELDSDFGMYSGAMLASACDEAVYSHNGASIEDFYNGSWSPANSKAHLWNSAWTGIQYANLVLGSYSDLTFDDYKSQNGYVDAYRQYINYSYECRFLRAYLYFTLLREYGGVPIITTEMSADEVNSQPRNSIDEVFAFIDSECADIIDTTRTTEFLWRDTARIAAAHIAYDNTNPGWSQTAQETGRADVLTVLCLRARAALYHASPLFAGDNDQKELWGIAAARCKEVLDDAKNRGKSLNSDYAALFAPESYKLRNEVIFDRRALSTTNNVEKYNFPVSMTNAQGGNCPSQNLVEAYETINGLTIDEDTAFDATNPYANRDPRLTATVAVNGESWPQALPKVALETFIGGADGLPAVNATPTGYYLKKYINGSTIINGSSANAFYHNWLVFRLGEFYLDYAEAVANYLGSGYATGECDGVALDMSAAEAINVVRSRVKMPPIKEGLSLDQFLERYKNERFVELAFEGHRFYDIRRWKEGDKHLAIKTMEITMNADSSFNYNVKVDETTRKWDDKYYFFPISQSEMMKQSGGWSQNPGW